MPILVKSKIKGFTLIELLVVIAIIGLLSSIVLASLNSARRKARDAARTSGIRQVQVALELYYDTNGKYPTAPDITFPGSGDLLSAALTPTYISRLPSDPTDTYRYFSNSENPATFYAIRIPYETKTACYVCAGSICQAGQSWWGLNIC